MTSVLKRESQIDYQWGLNLEKLREYKNKHGNPNVPITYEDKSLAIWVMNQRQINKQGKMREERFNQLSELGFEWTRVERRSRTVYTWDNMYEELVLFKSRFSHLSVPSAYVSESGAHLGEWVVGQRFLRTKGKVSEYKLFKLNRLGFVWNVSDWEWQFRINNLKAILDETEDRTISLEVVGEKLENCQATRVPLGKWLEKQLKLYEKGELSEEKRRAIDDLNIVALYSRRDGEWNETFNKLLAYKEEFGTANLRVLPMDNPYYKLSLWANNQRAKYSMGKLDKRRVEKLESIGFVWKLKEAKQEVTQYPSNWNEKYIRLKMYWEEHNGDLMGLRGNDRELHEWVIQQMSRNKRGFLHESQVALFKELNITKETYSKENSKWMISYNRFKEVAELSKQSGEIIPVIDYVAYLWFQNEYRFYSKNELPQWKLDKLKLYEYVYNTEVDLTAHWVRMYQRYIVAVGDGKPVESLRLRKREVYEWAKKQAKKHEAGMLSSSKIQLLNQINFDFSHFQAMSF